MPPGPAKWRRAASERRLAAATATAATLDVAPLEPLAPVHDQQIAAAPVAVAPADADAAPAQPDVDVEVEAPRDALVAAEEAEVPPSAENAPDAPAGEPLP